MTEKDCLLYGFLTALLFWSNLTEDQKYAVNTMINTIKKIDTEKDE